MNVLKAYIGIDLGATKTNIGIMDGAGKVLCSRKVPTRNEGEESIHAVDRVASTMVDMIKEAQMDSDVECIGIGVPGTVDRNKGAVIFAPNLGWRDVPVRDIFSWYFSAPVVIGQDTEAAALGEFLYGAGSGLSDMACITIGTGVGCGLILGGRLYKGRYFTAGEFGHTIVEKDGLDCNCGKKGCLEAYASGTAILKRYRIEIKNGSSSSLQSKKEIDEIKTEDIFDEAKYGDPLSIKVIDEAVDYLSIGLTNLINLICPEAVILSGGICTEGDLFISPLIKKTYSRIYSLLVGKVKIMPAALGEYSPMVGAAMLFRDSLYN